MRRVRMQEKSASVQRLAAFALWGDEQLTSALRGPQEQDPGAVEQLGVPGQVAEVQHAPGQQLPGLFHLFSHVGAGDLAVERASADRGIFRGVVFLWVSGVF